MIVQTLGEWSSHVSIETIALKDFFLGFFLALALRRGRIRQMLNKATPTNSDTE